MKTWAKIAIGCLVVLVVFCVVGILAAVFAGSWLKEKWGGFFGGAMQTGQNIQAIQQLDQKFAFTEPADGVLSEARLQAFLGIGQKVKAVVGTHEAALRNAVQGDNSGNATEILQATGALTQAFREGLEGNRMSVSEYRWISNAAYGALGSGSGDGGSGISGMEGFEAMTRASLEVLEPQLNDPSLTPEQRQALESQIAELKAQLGHAPVGGGDPNAALVEKYRSVLEESDVRDYLELGLGGR